MNNLPKILTLEGDESSTHIHSNDPALIAEVVEFLLERGYQSVATSSDMMVFEDIDVLETILSCEESLNEGIAKRKQVVRKGKRRIIFKCKPGEKKVRRSCVKRNTTELSKMKRRAKRSARKARSKRSRANRRRKLSMKRRLKKPTAMKHSKPPVTKAPSSKLKLKH